MNKSLFTSNSHWLLRIGVSSVFLYHGILNIINLEGVINMLPIPFMQTMLITSAQLFGSLLLLIGGVGRGDFADFITRFGAAINLPLMIAVIFLSHDGQWVFAIKKIQQMGDMEFQAVLFFLLSYLALMGNNIILKADYEQRKIQATYLPYRTETSLLKTFGEI